MPMFLFPKKGGQSYEMKHGVVKMGKSEFAAAKAILILALGIIMILILGSGEPFIRRTYSIYEQIVQNPGRPHNPKAGRTVRLKETVRLTDESGKFYFRYVGDAKFAPDKSLFILDRQQLLQFSKEGKYLRNYYKKGQGPGELNQVTGFDFAHDGVIVHSFFPQKAVWFDFQGRLITDISLEKSGIHLWFYFFGHKAYWFVRDDIPPLTGRTESLYAQQVVVAVSENGKEVADVASYVRKGFAVGNRYRFQDSYGVRFKKRYFIFSNSREYSFHILDCELRKALRSVTRKYDRIRCPPNRREEEIIGPDGKKFPIPGANYLTDIQGLFEYRGTICVMTSTTNIERGTLIDVFNINGEYIDAFWLKFRGSLISVSEDVFFVREKAEDETIQVVGYKVVE